MGVGSRLMSTKPAAIPLFADAYLADTMHLSTEEHGAYLLMLMAAWRFDDCSLPNDDKKLAKIVRLSTRRWMQIRDTIMEFWTADGDRIFNARLRKERGYVVQKSESNRKNARKRWDQQSIENIGGDPCEGICDGNAPPPPPILEPNGSNKKEHKRGYAFAGKVVKITEPDLQKWQQAYHLLDVPALLQGRDDWLATQPPKDQARWFQSTSAWLANRQQQATERSRPQESEHHFTGPC